MEARNITIVSTVDQHKYVVNTDATTLAELKAALRANGISYEGMTFYEGISHTELLTDEAVLPHDLPYKGNITNELVFMLTAPNKKIKSGNFVSARQALYSAIKEADLQSACVEKYGRNFTQCSNLELVNLLEENEKSQECAASHDDKVEAALRCLVDILEDDSVLFEEDGKKIRRILEGNGVAKSPYSDKEIDEMFDFMD